MCPGVLIVVPSRVPGQAMSEINTERGQRPMILVVQRCIRFEGVEFRCAPSDAGEAVTKLCRHPLGQPKYDRAHAVMSVVGVIAVGQKRVIRFIGGARSRIGNHRQDDPVRGERL